MAIDADFLNRAGITLEFVGALFIAPEVIDRLIGFKRIEDASERLIERSASSAFRIMASEGEERPSWVPITFLVSWTYYSVFAAAVVIAIGAGGWLNPMWWVTGSGLILLPALLQLAVMAALWVLAAVTALSQRRPALAVLMLVATTPLWLIVMILLFLATPILAALESLMRRLQDGWISTAFLLVGVPLVLFGLALQFASTF